MLRMVLTAAAAFGAAILRALVWISMQTYPTSTHNGMLGVIHPCCG